jgi:hypothetical protein
MRQGQLTPVSSSSGSRSVSPKTPNGRTGAGRSDDYFAPTIANEYESTPPQQRRPGGYGGFTESDGYDMDPLYPPSSPKKQQANVLQRMNTIAPGPFEMNRRRGGGAAKNAFAPRNDSSDNLSDYSRSGYGSERPGTSASNMSFSSGSNNGAGIAPPRLPRKDGYGGFGPPPRSQDDFRPEPFGVINRSDTLPIPRPEPVDVPLRTPSAPGPRPDRFRRPSNASSNGGRPSLGMGPDTTRAPPPRTSLVRPPTAGKDSMPSINLADEFGIGNPYHTPSGSMSSSYSTFSRPSQTSGSSLSRSASRRNASDTSSFDNLMNDLQSSMGDMKPKELPRLPQQSSSYLNDLPPKTPKTPNGTQSRRRRPSGVSSRFDAALQGLDKPRRDDRYGSAIQDGGYGGWDSKQQPRDRSPPTRQVGGRDPAVQSARGSCKSCGLIIKGKSVSSADGRLTGRYHKACFVCTTCSEPFTSAEFYVMNDQPYCELHYHKLNGSLCGSCGRGIEGQYLEDETLVKYHPGCFRCGDCGKSLSEGYFEVSGKAYCERDAWRRVQQQQPWASTPGPVIVEPEPEPVSAPVFDTAPGPTPMVGLPGRPNSRRPSAGSNGAPRRPMPFGLPSGGKLAPGTGLGPRPRMNKRMTRLGMM